MNTQLVKQIDAENAYGDTYIVVGRSIVAQMMGMQSGRNRVGA